MRNEMLMLQTAAVLLLAAAQALQPDANMAPTYARLAQRCASLHTKLQRQVWIGITGGPGAGKSTVADAVARCCNDLGYRAMALPMDGFHFSKEKLRDLDPPDAATLLPLRGAPQTFDAEAFCAAVAAARRSGRQCINQIFAARLIMASTPSTRRQLDVVAVWSLTARFSQHGRVLADTCTRLTG